MLYDAYEMQRSFLAGASTLANIGAGWMQNPANPFAYSGMGPIVASALDVFAHASAPRGKPAFGLKTTVVDRKEVTVREEVVLRKPFGQLLHFRREGIEGSPRLLVVAPMSGHYATLLRGTVERLLPSHDVFITDWTDAKTVPLSDGHFDLDDYIDYVISMLHHLKGDAHVIAVCQPAVPVLAAVALMEADKDPYVPRSMVLMGGPIDTRISSNSVDKLAENRGIEWFRRSVVTKVPFPHPGFMRAVYPGFLQLNGFVSMNLDRHVEAHRDLFLNLVKGDGDSVTKHREFYDEYLAVMDLDGAFYLQTVDTVFIKHSLPKGEMTSRGRKIDPSLIRRVALMTVEGENDDISGVGQTEAAHRLCANIPAENKVHYLQPEVGHYGVFNGSRFRSEIAPRIADFALSHNGGQRTDIKKTA